MLRFSEEPRSEPRSAPLPTASLPPSLAERGPRAVRLTPEMDFYIKACRGLSFAIVALGIPIAITQANDVDALAKRGEVMRALVSSVNRDEDGHKPLGIGYRFSRQGTSYAGEASVPEASYPGVQVGDPVSVTVLPDRPSVHRLGTVSARDVQREQLGGSLFVVLFSAGVGLIGFLLRARSRRERTVLETWTAVPAEVTQIANASRWRWRITDRTVHYQMRLPNGELHDGQYAFAPLMPLEVKPGDVIPVLHAPDDVAASRPLFSLSSVEVARTR